MKAVENKDDASRSSMSIVQVLDGENDKPRTCSLRDLWPLLRSRHGYQALVLSPPSPSKVRITAHDARWMNNHHRRRRLRQWAYLRNSTPCSTGFSSRFPQGFPLPYCESRESFFPSCYSTTLLQCFHRTLHCRNGRNGKCKWNQDSQLSTIGRDNYGSGAGNIRHDNNLL